MQHCDDEIDYPRVATPPTGVLPVESDLYGHLRYRFHREIVNHAAPVLTGIKPASLFSFFPAEHGSKRCSAPSLHPMFDFVLNEFEYSYKKRDIRIDVLHDCEERRLLLVSRSSYLSTVLNNPENSLYLSPMGYKTTDLESSLQSLKRKIANYHVCRKERGGKDSLCCNYTHKDSFPHEIGIFLGYPLEDVQGFITNRGRDALCSGYWKVYSDKNEAIDRFCRYRTCTKKCQEEYRKGTPIDAMIA